MNDGYESGSGKGPRRSQKVDRAEQGDLLADAVTGLFSQQASLEIPEGPEKEAVGETAPVPEAGPMPDSLWEQKIAWAKERAREGRLEEAEELYRELVEEDPTSVRALNNLGVLLDEMGDHEGAVVQLRAARRIDPQNQEILGNLGAALGAMGRYAEAEEALRVAFRLDPTSLEIRTNRGILLFRRGLYEEATAELEVVCAARPDDGLPLFYKGEALNRLGKVEEAIEALERVIELIPGSPRAYYTLGVLFDKKALPERAAVMYRKARGLPAS
jgi:Flp pilus assembly protein TadD